MVSTCANPQTQADLPHVDVKVLGKVCGQACCWGGSADGLHSKVILLAWRLHAQISKIK